VHPVRARKVRYYEDPQFQRRVLQSSRAVPINFSARRDEWSGLRLAYHLLIWFGARLPLVRAAKQMFNSDS
jgi:type IV secretory pathway TraG/TraD family ATPase VirD4